MSGGKKRGMRIGHTNTKRCERNKGERRVEDKGMKVYKKFQLKWHRELTLMIGTCVPIQYGGS